MTKKKQQSLLDRLFRRWQQILANEKQEVRIAEQKPFPKNRFYSPEELHFLSQESRDHLSEVDRWALSLSEQAYGKTGKKGGLPFVAVQWVDGLMSTYTNGQVHSDSAASQAEKLSILKANGYELSAKHELFICNYDADKLVGKIFNVKEEGLFMQVDDAEKRPDQHPVLKILKWKQDEPETIMVDNLDYIDFKEQYGSKILSLTKEEQGKLSQVLNDIDTGKQLFDQTISMIKNLSPSLFGDSFPADRQQKTATDLVIGGLTIIPTVWQLSDNDTIRLKYKDVQCDIVAPFERETDITRNNAYKTKEIISLIRDDIQEKCVKGKLHALISVMGSDMGGGNKVYLFRDVYAERTWPGDALVATSDGKVKTFDTTTHGETPLTPQELVQIYAAIETEAKAQQQELRNKVAVAELGDYYHSLRDKHDALSGDDMLLPTGTTLERYYNKLYKIEEEYHGNNMFMHPDDRKSLQDEYNQAYVALKSEHLKMIDAYEGYSIQRAIANNLAIDNAKNILVAEIEKCQGSDGSLAQRAYKALHSREHNHPIDKLYGSRLQQEQNMRNVLEYVIREGAFPQKLPVPEPENPSKLGVDVLHHLPRYIRELENLDELLDGRIHSYRPSIDTENIELPHTENVNRETAYVHPASLQPMSGRWHTEQYQMIDAYQRYGRLLAESKKLAVADNWMVPQNIDGTEYKGLSALMLQLESREKGYASPIFVSLSESMDQGIKVKADAQAFPVITCKGVDKVYNLSKTDFPLTHPAEYREMEREAYAEANERSYDQGADVRSIVNHPHFSTQIVFDGQTETFHYDAKENVIHMPANDTNEVKDSDLENLARGIIMSMRRNQQETHGIQALLEENIIAHIGTGLLGVVMNFDTTKADSSRLWEERLKTDPDYTKNVMASAERAANNVFSFLGLTDKISWQAGDPDLRSLTPVNFDTDGNGIVDSSENLAADKKQGAEEGRNMSPDEANRMGHPIHKGR